MSVSPLSPSELKTALPTLTDWRLEDNALVRHLRFTSHPDAIAFIVRLAFIHEKMNHHAEMLNVWANLTFTLRTHDAGDQVTALDVKLAREINELWAAWGKGEGV